MFRLYFNSELGEELQNFSKTVGQQTACVGSNVGVMFEALVLDKAYQSAIGGWWALCPVAGTRRDVACFVPSALAGDGCNVVEYVYFGDLSSINSIIFICGVWICCFWLAEI